MGPNEGLIQWYTNSNKLDYLWRFNLVWKKSQQLEPQNLKQKKLRKAKSNAKDDDPIDTKPKKKNNIRLRQKQKEYVYMKKKKIRRESTEPKSNWKPNKKKHWNRKQWKR